MIGYGNHTAQQVLLIQFSVRTPIHLESGRKRRSSTDKLYIIQLRTPIRLARVRNPHSGILSENHIIVRTLSHLGRGRKLLLPNNYLLVSSDVRTPIHLGRVRKQKRHLHRCRKIPSKNPHSPREGAEIQAILVTPTRTGTVRFPSYLERVRKRKLQYFVSCSSICKTPQLPR